MQVFCHIDIQCRTLVSSLGRGYFNPSEKNSLEKHITCTNKIHFTLELSNRTPHLWKGSQLGL